MGKGLGKTQKKILRILKASKQPWVGLHILIIKTYHPAQLDGSKGYLDWSYRESERKTIWESVNALERKGLVKTRIRRRKEIELKKRFGGIQWWLEVALINSS